MKHYSIKLVLRTDKILKNGNSPICIQVIINSKKKRISTGESVNPKHWDKKKWINHWERLWVEKLSLK